MRRPLLVLALAAATMAGCASLTQTDPVQVTVAGIESLPGEGLETRMLVKLRVQNPNDQPIDYNGVYVRLDVMNNAFATGVSGTTGTVPRFGEAVIGVPVTISMLHMARQVLSLLDGTSMDKVTYNMSGKLEGAAFRTLRFKAQGEFGLPAATTTLDPDKGS